MILTDFAFIEEGSKDPSIGSGLINVNRLKLLAEQLKIIQLQQKLDFPFTPVPILRDVLKGSSHPYRFRHCLISWCRTCFLG
jgi:hypothetical protein